MSKIYLLYGEEKYDLNKKVKSIEKEFENLQVGLNLFYITKENIDELDTVSQGVTFFGTKKLIILKETGLKFNINLLEENDEDTTYVIIENSVDKRLTEYKKLSKIAECIEYKHLDQNQMADYLYNMIKRYGLVISYEDAAYMCSVCGEDKSNNINELQKIVTYLKKGDSVTKEIIDKICARTLNAKIFDVLNLIVNKNKEKAISLLNDLLEQREPIIKIYIMLYKQVYQMYIIKQAKQHNVLDAAKLFGIHPFVYKNLASSSDKYTLEKLKEILHCFDEYDEKTKLGEMDFEIGLKKIICAM
ncbi:MAG: DNA polymerase III subunit delta [Clostridia bacterium]|nr:DNA polymerase III subunit delta [Clostridia bacterium]